MADKHISFSRATPVLIPYVFDGGGSEITGNPYGFYPVDFAGYIQSVSVALDDSPTLVDLDIQTCLITSASLAIQGERSSLSAILEREETARKILHSTNGSVLLEEQEWINLKNAVQGVTGFSRQDSQFIRRVLDAPQVDVEAKGEPQQSK